MKISCIFQTARNAVLELENNGIFELEEGWEILVNGAFYGETKRVITSVYGLKPDTDYEITVRKGEESASVRLHTDHEFVTLNVRDFGAKGDGVQNDTLFIQAADYGLSKGGACSDSRGNL